MTSAYSTPTCDLTSRSISLVICRDSSAADVQPEARERASRIEAAREGWMVGIGFSLGVGVGIGRHRSTIARISVKAPIGGRGEARPSRSLRRADGPLLPTPREAPHAALERRP